MFLESANALDDYVALTASTAAFEKEILQHRKLDGRIIWHPALNGHKGILFASYEPAAGPGAYLRATRDGLVVAPSDYTAEFADDASFKLTYNSGGSFVLESIGQPGLFLRHRGAALALDPPDGSADFSADASFLDFRLTADSAGHLNCLT